MRLPRVYIGTELASGRVIELDRGQGHYLKNVLRLKPGAAFFLFDGRSASDYAARLLADGKRLKAEIGAARQLDTEPMLDCEIVQGLGRGDHMDWTIQKTTELGVRRIRMFNAERTQSPLKAAQTEKKLQHWRGVAISACEQCGRAILPQIVFHANLARTLADVDSRLRLLLDFSGESLAAALPDKKRPVSLLLGPEGGLSPREIELATASAYRPVSLGTRVLRTETAATAALAIVQSKLGDLA